MENFIKWLAKEISYDATLVYSCDRCGNEPKSYWFDHKDSLVSAISQRIGVKALEPIRDCVEDVYASGDREKDAREIAILIDDRIGSVK